VILAGPAEETCMQVAAPRSNVRGVRIGISGKAAGVR
jgi:hypothetical protein